VSLAEREQMAVERVAGDQQQTAHDAQIACNGGGDQALLAGPTEAPATGTLCVTRERSRLTQLHWCWRPSRIYKLTGSTRELRRTLEHAGQPAEEFRPRMRRFSRRGSRRFTSRFRFSRRCPKTLCLDCKSFVGRSVDRVMTFRSRCP
jgi:hypothetical protein